MNTVRRTPELHEIKYPTELAIAWLTAKWDAESARRKLEPDEDVAALDQKFAAIDRWLTACFVESGVDIILEPHYEKALRLVAGKIVEVENDGWSLILADCPDETAPHPTAETVQPVSVDFHYMDDGLEAA